MMHGSAWYLPKPLYILKLPCILVVLYVAAVSGDARRALEICRRVAELADYRMKNLSKSNTTSEGNVLVGMAEVEAAIKEMFQAPHIQVMRSCSKLWCMSSIKLE